MYYYQPRKMCIISKEIYEKLLLLKTDNLKKNYLDVYYLDVHRI